MRKFRVKVTSEFTLTDDEMRILLKEDADRLLSIEDNDDLEWRILDDDEVVRSIELVGAIAHAMTKMQLSVSGEREASQEAAQSLLDDMQAEDDLWQRQDDEADEGTYIYPSDAEGRGEGRS